SNRRTASKRGRELSREETMLARGALVAAVAVFICSPGFFGAAQGQDVLSATTALPKTLTNSANFLKWVDRVNEIGQGGVQIEYGGGPEAIPSFEQGAAVRSGAIDMIHTPANYYAGVVPETDALVAGNRPPSETRANGGFELLNQIHQRKMNVYLLGN